MPCVTRRLVVYSFPAGTEYCCDYNELGGPTITTKYKWTWYLTIYILLGIGCGIIFFVGPGIIAYRRHLIKRVRVYPINANPVTVTPAPGVTAASPASVMSIPPPVEVTAQPAAANVQPTVTPAAADTDPASQKGGVVVEQPASNPTL